MAAGAAELAARGGALPGRAAAAGAGRPEAEDAQPGLRQALRGLAGGGHPGRPGGGGDVDARCRCGTWSGSWPRGGSGAGRTRSRGCCTRTATACRACPRSWKAGSTRTGTPSSGAINALIAEFRRPGTRWSAWTRRRRSSSAPIGRAGRSWRPAGDPVRVRDHDFPDAELGKITPYGVYDIAANTGFVSVGTSHDTAAFAVNALRLWWQREGALRYPGARRLLVTCDAGGSNSCTRPALERPAGRPGGGDGPGDHRLPLPARHVEVEQDRAPAVLPHHPHLARPAADDQGGRRRRHRRDHHRPGPEVHRRPRRRGLPRRGQGPATSG